MTHGNTIAAISTPPGKGGVAVIRISGDCAFDVAAKIFVPKSKKSISVIKPRMQIYGDIYYGDEPIDDGMITLFPAPNSYTGEDTVEISCHGGILVTSKVLEAALTAGASLAEGGEFTKRAFMNGKLSLTETEAISMLLEAESEAKIRLSRAESRSRLAVEIQSIRESVTSLLSSIYARIDYPDEDLGDFTEDETRAQLSAIIQRVEKLISTYKTGRAVNEGLTTVICGKPNVGKSTLYNLLLGEDAAIVTDIPGTTRDVLERTLPLGDVLLKLYDTAGIRDGQLDRVEAIGIERSLRKIESAELIFALFDASRPLDDEDYEMLEYLKCSSSVKVAIITKVDSSGIIENNEKYELLSKNGSFASVIRISAKESEQAALSLIKDTVAHLFTDEKIVIGTDAIVASARQNASLVKARDFLSTALDAYNVGLAQDAASSDIELALGAISELDGRAVSEEVVNDIFAKFCVGK